MVPFSYTDSRLKGFMFLNRHLRFVSTCAIGSDAVSVSLPASHELGHVSDMLLPERNTAVDYKSQSRTFGVTFNLSHTFSKENRYMLSEGTTDNLLDYNGGTALYKYQWDLIHNPQKIWFAWLEGEEEGELGGVKKYFITINGHKVFELSMDVLKEIKNEFYETSKLNNEQLKNYKYKIYDIYSIYKNYTDNYTVSTLVEKNGSSKGTMDNIYFGNELTTTSKTIEIRGNDEIIHLYYYSPYEFQGAHPAVQIRIIRVLPNVMYKVTDKINFLIKKTDDGNIKNTTAVNSNILELCPILLTPSEINTDEDISKKITQLYKRNIFGGYLIKGFYINGKPIDDKQKLELY